MKFKVGDKVKVINCDNAGTNCENFNKVSTITNIVSMMKYPYKLKGIIEAFREEELELVERQFTKSDLLDGDLVTYRNGSKGIKNRDHLQKIGNCGIFASLLDYTEKLKQKENRYKDLDIIKVERPVKYETIFQRVEEEKKEILDKVEKNYLKIIIKPIRSNIKYIEKDEKISLGNKEFLVIYIKDEAMMIFPSFKKGTMYSGMKLNKKYTLEELGI